MLVKRLIEDANLSLVKNYIAKHSTRSIPVGYSAADVREILVDTWEYLQCAIDGKTDDPSRIDFFGLNSYSWCGPTATFQSSQYDVLTSDFSNTTVPVFFSGEQHPLCRPGPVGEILTSSSRVRLQSAYRGHTAL